MAFSSLPYHLRPHKSVDRRLFLDLLARFERWRALLRYAYISMGAYALEDHKLVHRLLGIKRLIAFDADEEIVKRQKFNRPCETCECFQKFSGDVIDQLDDILTVSDASDVEGLIIWLDYTSPHKLGEQIPEFQALLDRLSDGDILRITVNAHLPALGEARQNGVQLDVKDVREKRFNKLNERIGDYLPSGASPSDMKEDRLAVIIAQSFGKAAADAFPVSGSLIFAPLSIVRYSDNQQMLSLTGSVVEKQRVAEMVSKMELVTWPFASLNWYTVHVLSVPDLTIRERMFLERAILRKSPEEIAEQLGFDFGKDLDLIEFLKNYKDYYRFYPTLLPTEL